MTNTTAYFDFDGTLTFKDTLLDNIRFQKGSLSFAFGFLLNSPWLLAYKLKIISNQQAKERILTHFFKGTTVAQFEQNCARYAGRARNELLRQKGLQEIQKHLDKGHRVVIVTASSPAWVVPFFEGKEVQVLGTLLEEKNGILTGKIVGKNCYGQEKTERIRMALGAAAFEHSYGYGDTNGDLPMLGQTTIRFYKPFR